jgi:serine/threonine-protein kinase
MITPVPRQTDKTYNGSSVQRRLVLAGWLAIFVVTGVLFFIGLPVQRDWIITQHGGNFTEYSLLGLQPLGISQEVAITYDLCLDILTTAVFLGTALTLFWRRSSDRMVFLTALMLVTWGGTSSTDSIKHLLLNYPGNLLYLFLSGIGNALFVWFIYTFPDGKFSPKWSRWIVYIYGAWSFLAPLLFAAVGLDTNDFSFLLRFVLPIIVFVTGSIIQLWRQRHYLSQSQRQQVKWIVAGFTALLTAFVGLFMFPVIFPALQPPGPILTTYNFFFHTYLKATLIGIPITIAFSVSRYRLWEVDLTINRGLVYGGLTISLGAIFILVTVVLQLILQRILPGGSALLVIAIAAILVGALFSPIRTHLQQFVDRRLYGIKVEFREGKMDKGARADARPLATFTQGVSEFPAQFGQYEITGLIARGGMGEVYKARPPSFMALSSDLALKMLPNGISHDTEVRERFVQESEVIARLDHPNIVHLHDYGSWEHTYFMVMDFVIGKTLSDLLRARGALPIADAWSLLRDVALALDYAHGQGVVHRDVKPSNIMVRSDGHAILMDFGLAKLANVTGITRSGVVGTLEYMSPEQIMGSTVDGRADIYSLGIAAFELLTGKRPFAGDNAGVIIFGHLNRPAPNPREIQPDVPVNTARAIMRALEKRPDDRFKNAVEFIEAGQVMV